MNLVTRAFCGYLKRMPTYILYAISLLIELLIYLLRLRKLSISNVLKKILKSAIFNNLLFSALESVNRR